MIEALSAGVSDAEALANLARGRLRSKLPALREALDGRVDATHRILLRQQLDLIDFLQGQIEQLCVPIDEHLHPYESQIARLMQIPGIGRLAAAAILAEIGTDMSRFPSAKHLASWAGVAPGNRQSGGKRLRASTNKGNKHLRATLAEVVWVISHTHDNYLSEKSHRLARRIGKKKAIVAVSHSVLTIIYHPAHVLTRTIMISAHTTLRLSIPPESRDTAVRRLQALGYKVTLEELQEVSA